MKIKTVGVVKGAMPVAVICLSNLYPQAVQHIFPYYITLVCACQRRWKTPFWAINSLCVPHSATSPLSITTILSASLMVLRRWAIRMMVLPCAAKARSVSFTKR